MNTRIQNTRSRTRGKNHTEHSSTELECLIQQTNTISEPFGKHHQSIIMAVVLGPELDMFLREIGEDLKGKTKVNYVDQETIIRACSAQNKVILTMQEQILRMQEVERGMQRALRALEEKVNYFENYTKKVDVIEEVLADKIPLLDKMNEVVKEHDAAIERHETNLKKNEAAFDAFRNDTKSKLLETTQDVTNIRSKINLLPKTIVISSRQVTHSAEDEGSTVKSVTGGKHLLVDIISQQEQHAYIQDESTKNIEERLDKHLTMQDELNIKVDNEMNDLTTWKEEQNGVDLIELKSNQDFMKASLESHDQELATKMTKQDVTKKLDLQFKEIVDHLQSALTSVEKDEGDFKSITDTLSKMCKALRENKADKSDINALRKQFIENQIEMEDDFGGISSSGSTLDNEGIRKILMDYPTKETVLKLMNAKIDKKTAIPEFARMNAALQSMEGTIQKLVDASADETLREHETYDSKSELLKRESIFSLNDLDDADDIGDMEEQSSYSNQKSTSGFEDETAEMRQDDIDGFGNGPLHVMNARSIGERIGSNPENKRKHKNTRSKQDEACHFPSSNMLKGALNELPPNEEGLKRQKSDIIVDNTFVQGQPIRPSSAPISNRNHPQQKILTKKLSLPAILTSISRTMRPRSKFKAKIKSGGVRAFATTTASDLELNKSSSHFADLPPVSEGITKFRPTSSSSERRKRHNGITTRTSIE